MSRRSSWWWAAMVVSVPSMVGDGLAGFRMTGYARRPSAARVGPSGLRANSLKLAGRRRLPAGKVQFARRIKGWRLGVY
jgi:hypothetical protein